VPDRAQWCSLCFADLREPAPAPVPAAAAVPEQAVATPEAPTPELPEPVAATSRVHTGAPAVLAGTPLDPHTPLPGTEQHAGDTLVAAPAALPASETTTAAAEPTATWPCPRCGDNVALALDACPSCGAGFLSGATQHMSTKLPVLGDVTAMTSGQRWLVAMGISGAIVVVLVVILFLIGSIF
jgi:hypothetical protein